MEIPVRCNSCDATLDAQFDRRGVLCIDPCEKCLEAKRKDGYDEGYSEAKEAFDKEE